jgi:hypothetical protein
MRTRQGKAYERTGEQAHESGGRTTGEEEREGRAERSGRMKVDVKQQETLERFFEEEKTWFANNIFYKYCGYLLIGVSLIMAVFPQKAMDGDAFWSCLAVYMLYIYGISMLCFRFTIYSEQNGPAKSVNELLKYLPVSELQYRIFKFKKFIKPCFFLTLFILAAKIGISLLAYHSITVWDVLVPVIFYLLLPMILFFPVRRRVL